MPTSHRVDEDIIYDATGFKLIVFLQRLKTEAAYVFSLDTFA